MTAPYGLAASIASRAARENWAGDVSAKGTFGERV
jgi:hypothetical protein